MVKAIQIDLKKLSPDQQHVRIYYLLQVALM